MELFHQTVSMKSVGNLTDFVRAHMLEPFDAAGDVRKLIDHFEDLTAAHDAVIKARTQLEALIPIVAGCDEVDRLRAELAEATSAQQACGMPPRPSRSSCWRAELADIDTQARHRARRPRPRPRSHRVLARRSSRGCATPEPVTPAGGSAPSRRPGSGIRPTGKPRQAAPGVERRPRRRLPRAPGPPRRVRARARRRGGRPRGRRRRAGAPRRRAHRRTPSTSIGCAPSPTRSATSCSASVSAARASRASCSRSASDSAAKPASTRGASPSSASSSTCVPRRTAGAGRPSACCAASRSRSSSPTTTTRQVAGWVDGHHLGTRLVYHRVRVGDRHQPADPVTRHARREARHQAEPVCRVAGRRARLASRARVRRRASRTYGARPAP